MIYESKNEEQTVNSLNSIMPLSVKDLGVSTGVVYDDYVALANKLTVTADSAPGATGGTYHTTEFGKLFSKHMIWGLKNQYNFDKCKSNRINFQVPCPLFMADELLHFGADGAAQIVLNVDPQWASNLIQIAGSPVCSIGDGSTYAVTTYSSIPTTAKSIINVTMKDLKLYICRAHVTNAYVPRSISQTIYLKQFSPFLVQLSPGTNNTITAPMESTRRITHIAIAFLCNSGTNFKYSPCDFSSGFSVDKNNQGVALTTESKKHG